MSVRSVLPSLTLVVFSVLSGCHTPAVDAPGSTDQLTPEAAPKTPPKAVSGTKVRQPRLTGQEFVFTRHKGLVYAVHDRRSMRLDLCIPDSPGPHPIALVIHGGAWRTGSRYLMDSRALMNALAREGIAAASLTYRLAPRHPHPAQLEDCRLALGFLRDNAEEYGLDAERICAIGASSGGHLAALLGTMSVDAGPPGGPSPVDRRRPSCVVAICAPMLLVPTPGETPSPLQVDTVAVFLGIDKITDVNEALRMLLKRGREASPREHVSSDDAPMLLIYGEHDPVVLPSQATQMATALAEVGVAQEIFEVKGGSHGEFLLQSPRDWLETPPEFWLRVRQFLGQHLLGG